MSSLRLFLLGSPRLERDEVPVEFRYRKNVALLAYLAVGGETHTRESLIALLWPEFEPNRARAGLRRNLSTLRRTLGEGWLAADRETVGLDLGAGLWVDVDRFHSLLRTCQEHAHAEADVCPACLVALDEALAKLESDDPEKANLVKLHYFAGLTNSQAADILKISIATANRHWSYARSWLFQEICKGD